MALITYPLNDIEYTAEDAELYNSTRTSGIYAGDDFGCTVSGENNNVVIGPGIGWIHNTKFSGKVVANKESVTLSLDVADAANPRIDVVAIRFDAEANSSDIVIKTGEASASPALPEIVQTETVYELYLYSIYRETAATVITAADITDLRLDETVCGLMADPVTEIDTSAINANVNAMLVRFKDLLEQIKEEWADIQHGNVNAYTREETLSDETKTLFGLDETAVPDDAFAEIAPKLNVMASCEVLLDANETAATKNTTYEYTLAGAMSNYNKIEIVVDNVRVPTEMNTISSHKLIVGDLNNANYAPSVRASNTAGQAPGIFYLELLKGENRNDFLGCYNHFAYKGTERDSPAYGPATLYVEAQYATNKIYLQTANHSNPSTGVSNTFHIIVRGYK